MPGRINELQRLVETLDDEDIKTLVELNISSGRLRDMGLILIELASCIDVFRDNPYYKEPRIRRIK